METEMTATTTLPCAIEENDLLMIAGGYIRVITDGAIHSETSDELTFDIGVAELLTEEAREIATFVAERRVCPSMIPYHFTTFGFHCAAVACSAAAVSEPPAKAIKMVGGFVQKLEDIVDKMLADARKRSNPKGAA
jgi:hypothetical protein